MLVRVDLSPDVPWFQMILHTRWPLTCPLGRAWGNRRSKVIIKTPPTYQRWYRKTTNTRSSRNTAIRWAVGITMMNANTSSINVLKAWVCVCVCVMCEGVTYILYLVHECSPGKMSDWLELWLNINPGSQYSTTMKVHTYSNICFCSIGPSFYVRICYKAWLYYFIRNLLGLTLVQVQFNQFYIPSKWNPIK